MKIHCIGIGGIGLSAVAQILKSQGHDLSGSDLKSSAITRGLEQNGIKVYYEQLTSNVSTDMDLVIYSEAISESNPERMKANELQIKLISYAQALGQCSADKKTIAITGTHGKTTVTGMLSSILSQTDLDPTVVIGSTVPQLDGKNYRIGAGEIFLTEACEYRDNFMELSPHIMVINTLEPDHLDYFKTPERYYQSFQNLAEKMGAEDTLILYEEAAQHLDLTKISAQVTILPENIQDQDLPELQMPGEHNRHNALSALAAAQALHISDHLIKKGLQEFSGTKRRFEKKGTLHGAIFYDDYGHHPTEIMATIQAARERYTDQHLTIVFQPHQYSRTREFFQEFANAFAGASEVWVTDIYQARDSQEDISSTSAEDLANAIPESIPSHFVPFSELSKKITTDAREGKVFILMGAGNISSIFTELDLQA